MLLAVALITYISYQFLFRFMPTHYSLEEDPTWQGYAIRIVVSYYITMTYVFILECFVASPGYLPKWLKANLTSDSKAPMSLIRIYDMRFWMRNKIYSFEEFDNSHDMEQQ